MVAMAAVLGLGWCSNWRGGWVDDARDSRLDRFDSQNTKKCSDNRGQSFSRVD